MLNSLESFSRHSFVFFCVFFFAVESVSQVEVRKSSSDIQKTSTYSFSPGQIVVSRRKRKGIRSQSSRWSVDTLFQWKAFWKSRKQKRAYQLTRKKRRRARRKLLNSSERERYEIKDLKTARIEKTLAFIEEFKNDPDIVVEADIKVFKQTADAETGSSFNDPYFLPSAGAWGQSFFDQWPLQKLEVERAWSISQGEGSLIAVIDTGVDYLHPELEGQIIKGRDFSNDDDDPMDDNGHGTHVAGTIVSLLNNGLGIAGVAPQAKVLAVKALDTEGSGSLFDVSEAIRYAVDSGAHVINLSLGAYAPNHPTYFASAMNYAQEKNVVVVTGSGNDASDVRFFIPANDPVAIAVGATDFQDERASFSNYGERLALTAPGGGDSEPYSIAAPFFSILSLKSHLIESGLERFIVGDHYLRLGGTSMAAPHVAGVAALLRSRFPQATSLQIRQMLQKGAQDIYSPGFDSESGFGRLHAPGALAIENPLEVQITDRAVFVVPSHQMTLSGIVRGSDLSHWELVMDDSQILFSGSNPVSGTMGTWNLLDVAKGYHSLKLQATDQQGREFSFRTDLDIEKAPPAFPTEVRGAVEDAGIRVSWNAPSFWGGSYLTDYVVQSSLNDGDWETQSDTVSPETGALIMGLAPGYRYRFRVAAINSEGQGAFSAPSDSLLLLGNPSVPQAIQVTPQDTCVLVSWNSPVRSGGSPIASYRVQSSSEEGYQTIADQQFEFCGLTNGVPFSVRVSAVNRAGFVSDWSEFSQAVIPRGSPAAPRDVSITDRGNGFVDLQWEIPENDGGFSLLSYLIEYSSDEGNTWAVSQEVEANQRQVRVSSLTNGKKYLFTVKGKNSFGLGSASQTIEAMPLGPPPTAPTGLVAIAQEGKVELRWVAPQNNGGYEIEDYAVLVARAGTNRPLYQHYEDGISAETRIVVLALEAGVAYEFKVAARNSFKSFENPKGQGPYSEVVIETPLSLPDPAMNILLLGSQVSQNQVLQSENGQYKLYIQNGRVWVTRQFTWRGRKYTLRRRSTPGVELSFQSTSLRSRSYDQFSIKDARGRIRYQRSWVSQDQNYLRLDNDGRLRLYQPGKSKALRLIY